ncbi:hypothetical protein NLI96_g3497 [Meripilus lineatus]|uniref:Uncharacterized protein n=1 Tax=Meripilus lineatus TaxID=2056292 RepID=A0AAD5YFL5_9APHY|nr:hypothetical protein NLI96_g3497 [Physisporinus lineatus]
MRPADDPLNGGSVPRDFVPLVLPPAGNPTALNNVIPPGPMYSPSIRSERFEVGAGTGASILPNVNINANFTFGCDASRGALLFLQDFADEAMHISKKQIIDYMRLNYRSWILFGSERGIVTDNEIMGPIFIRSTIKTSAWLVAAWMRQTRSNDAMVQCSSGHANAFLSFSLASGVNPSVQYRILPPHQQPPAVGTERDQCIFIDYFRFKERFFFNRQIVAAAEPRPDDAERFSEDKAGVLANNEETDPENEPFDPIDAFLDYILTKHPQADLAIASHGDLSLAFKKPWPTSRTSFDARKSHMKADTEVLGSDIKGKYPQERFLAYDFDE